MKQLSRHQDKNKLFDATADCIKTCFHGSADLSPGIRDCTQEKMTYKRCQGHIEDFSLQVFQVCLKGGRECLF